MVSSPMASGAHLDEHKHLVRPTIRHPVRDQDPAGRGPLTLCSPVAAPHSWPDRSGRWTLLCKGVWISGWCPGCTSHSKEGVENAQLGGTWHTKIS